MKKILIVDDNVSFTEFLDATVRAAGHETCVVHNGAEAIEAWESSEPDLVFLDVLLPKVDGFKVCQQIRSRENGSGSTPIVMMTGIYTKSTYKRDAVNRYGASDYLVKPFAITDIWQVLERQLGDAGVRAPVADCEEDPVAALLPETGQEAFAGVSLRDRPLALVLSDLWTQKKTGLLFLKGEVSTDVFFIEDGELAFVRSSDISQRLDTILENSGVLSSEQVQEARGLLVESRGQSRMGQIFVSLGHLTTEQLEETVQSQLRRRIHAAFQNEDLGFTFIEGPLPQEEDIRVHLDMQNVILEGVRTIPDSSTLVRHLPQPESILHSTGADPTALHLTGYEKQVLELANGRTTVGQALAIGRLAEIDITRTLFALLCLRAVQTSIDPAPVTDEEDTPSQEAGLEREKRPFPLPPQGDLRILPPARVLAALYRSARTGILELRGESGRRWIYVDGGKIVFGRSEDPSDRLGQVLVEGGLLNEADRERAVAMIEENPDKRLGQILVEQGLLGLEELRWAVVFQVQRIITSTLARTEGRYSFREGSLPTRETITVDLRTPDLLMEGLRRIPPDTAARHLPGDDVAIRPSNEAHDRIQTLQLTAQELDIWRALGTRGTLANLRQRRVAAPELTAVTLHMFLALGLLEKDEGRTQKETAAGAQMLEDIASDAEVQADKTKPAAATQPVAAQDKIQVDEPADDGGSRVPRFLYDQLLEERKALEAKLYETRHRLTGARAAAQEMTRIVKNFRENMLRRNQPIEVARLDPILEEMMDICTKSTNDIGNPGSEPPTESS